VQKFSGLESGISASIAETSAVNAAESDVREARLEN